MAPVIPFITETMYQNLKLEDEPESIHLAQWPSAEEHYRNLALERDMRIVRQAVSMGRSLRVAHDLKIRQPLASVQLVTPDSESQEVLSRMEDILREELNVKKVIIHEHEQDLVEYHAKANYRTLGKELGTEMKDAAARIAALSSEEILKIMRNERVELSLASGRSLLLDLNRVDIVREEKQGLRVLNEGTLTVAIDTTITPELLYEGYVRDLIRGVQNARKESGFEVTDRIGLMVSGDAELHSALDRFKELVAEETLARHLEWNESIEGTEVEAGEKIWRIHLKKA
jgi:isoleucyl-tRNA synthetase